MVNFIIVVIIVIMCLIVLKILISYNNIESETSEIFTDLKKKLSEVSDSLSKLEEKIESVNRGEIDEDK